MIDVFFNIARRRIGEITRAVGSTATVVMAAEFATSSFTFIVENFDGLLNKTNTSESVTSYTSFLHVANLITDNTPFIHPKG